MSKAEVQRLFDRCLADPGFLAMLETRPLPDLVLAARCAGFAVTTDALKGLIGAMEVHVITVVMGEAIDARSSLWPRMWGRSRLDYVVRELHAALPADARAQLAA